MQAIITRYHGPTNYRESRITARADAGQITVAWSYALGVEANHVAAARALRDKLGWVPEHYGELVSGSLPGGDGYAHVFIGRSTE